MSILCRLGLHGWEIAPGMEACTHRHEACTRCGKRRIRRIASGYAPVDEGWLATGEPTRRPSSARPPGATE